MHKEVPGVESHFVDTQTHAFCVSEAQSGEAEGEAGVACSDGFQDGQVALLRRAAVQLAGSDAPCCIDPALPLQTSWRSALCR